MIPTGHAETQEVLFIGAAFVVVNLFIDALYGVLDPRLAARHG